MDRLAIHDRSTSRLGDHLRAYSRPLAELSRLDRPGLRPLASAHAPVMLRAGRLVFTTAYGEARLWIDLARFPALESIASDSDRPRRIALANLILEPWLAPLRLGTTGLGVVPLTGLAITELSISGAGEGAVVCGLPLMIELASLTPLPCVVEDIAPALVAALDASHDGARPVLQAGRAALQSLLLPGRLRITSRAFRLALLRSANPGDVLLGWPLRQPYRAGEPLAGLTLLWGAPSGTHYRMSVDVDGSRITLTGAFTMMNDMLDDTAEGFADAGHQPAHEEDTYAHAAQDADPASPLGSTLDALDVLVHVEVAGLTLSLGALASMGPGHLLELPAPVADAPVRLVSCGRTVGTGQLVAVGDNLGVRIMQLAVNDGR